MRPAGTRGAADARASLLAEVDAVMAGAGDDLADEELFRRLGDARLLAVHYPTSAGGRGLRLADHVAVCERLGRWELPEELLLVTLQGVGCTLLAAGSAQQRDRWLGEFAGGRAFASLLLSERGAGTALSDLRCTARPTGDGYVLSGTKSWNLYADRSAVGLCAARTREGNAYGGTSLLLVPMDAPEVALRKVARGAGPAYFDVVFDDLHVPRSALVGPEHGGWPLILRAVGFERLGVDYMARAQRWLRATTDAAAELPPARCAGLAGPLLELERRTAWCRALMYRAADSAADGIDMDETASTAAKLACGELAQAIAWFATEHVTRHLAPTDPRRSVLRTAVSEAPELTVSGGVAEVQLDQLGLSLDLDLLLEGSAAEGADGRSAIASLFFLELDRRSGAETSALLAGGPPGRVIGDAPPVIQWASRHLGGPIVEMTEAQDAATVAIGRRDGGGTALVVSLACVRDAELRATARAASVIAGWSSRATSMAAAHAYERTLGGSPLNEFQAARHRLARFALAESRARFEVAGAAAALSAGDPRSRSLALSALATALDAALVTTRGLAHLQGASGTAAGEAFERYMAAHDAVEGLGPASALWAEAARVAPFAHEAGSDERHGL